MTRLLPLSILLLSILSVHAQTVQEAEKLIYYERYESARQLLHDVLQKDKKDAEAWYLLTISYLHDNKMRVIEDSFKLIPNDVDNMALIECAKGAMELKMGKKAEAGQVFKDALLYSKDKDPVILADVACANISSDSGSADYAIDLLNKAIKKDKSNAKLYIDLGNAYRKLGNGPETYKALNRALEMDPGNAEASYRLGLLFVSQNNPEQYLKYFYQATGADPQYGPAWYALYYYFYFRDPKKAMDYLQHYMACSDKSAENNYRLTDLLYLSKEYPAALKNAMALLETNDSNADPRLYKLIAYSYNGLNDSVNALNYLRKYFSRATDTLFLLTDMETMGDLYSRFPGKSDSAAVYYAMASTHEKDSLKRLSYYKTIAGLYKKIKDFKDETFWLEKYYTSDPIASNTDLFNWGIASYLSGDYKKADSVFSLYAIKYPEQTYGFYWAARSGAAIDTSMESGMAIPDYEKVIDLTLKEAPAQQNRKWLIEAYGYIAAYKANTQKNYRDAIDYLEKVIALDPGNENAKKYIEILKKNNSHAVLSKK